MKSFKLYIVALMALLVCTGFAQAQNSSVGQIKAFIVSGDVQVQGADGKSAPLSRGDLVAVGSTIKTGADGLVLIVFSNGAAMQIKADSKVAITKYDQAAFDDQDGANSFLRLNADPSKSTTEMDITKGTLAGQVKKLNLDAGSKFTIDTPAGSAGIRGTIPTVTVDTDSTGTVTGVVVACSQGDVTFTPSQVAGIPAALQGGTVDISEGGQVKLSLQSDPTTGQVTSITIAGQAYTGDAAQAVINALYAAINVVIVQQGGQPVTPPVAAGATIPNVTASTISTNSGTTIPVPKTNPTISGS